jgi:hypothetical protein
MRRFVQAAGIVAVALLMVASASASNIDYSTNSALTLFFNAGTGAITNNGLTLGDTTGVAATLTFNPNTASSSGTPSNINLGDFLLTCPTCSAQATNGGVGGTYFGAFQFDLVVTDNTDLTLGAPAVGEFVGTSTGGSVWSDVSQVNITWLPLQLGPGAGLSGNFGLTVFTITSPTNIPAPNSGCSAGPGSSGCGDVTVQGHVATSGVPEPATFVLLGAGLLGLGALRRKRA